MLLLQKKLDKIIKDVITPTLKKEGFRKSGRSFYKEIEHYGLCFNIQSSLYNHSEEVRFTLNTGIFIPEIYEFFFDQKSVAFPKEYECIQRKRIGELLGLRADLWYSITNDTDENELEIQLSSDIKDGIINYFGNFKCDSDVINIFKNKSFRNSPNDNAMIAGFIILYGDAEKGKEFFKEYYTSCDNEIYKQRLYRYATKLGINNI